ncbi:MAG TPA: DUF72 domain-containing protein [Vicinamibacterales bacterium]|nr:DUF72 domain-containing protein [Vicinamibacterales bacterium]
MILVGTSGYNYPEWKGSFYPADLPAAKMLPYYAARFPTVEINYTFYRMPTEKILSGWVKQVAPEFRFTLKAPRRITHDAKLVGCEDLTAAFCRVAGTLGSQLGALLFQLPPTLKKDVARLDAFLASLPPRAPAAFEFRHPSWFDDEVFGRLRQHHKALCVADSEKLETPLDLTADYGYFRLRDEGYQPEDIEEWGRKIAALQPRCKEIFVYFKHEEQGKGPAFARELMQHLHLS